MKISFIIPAYNASSTIDRCINSLIGQTDSDWDAVVVNDGSIDDTYSKVKNYAQKDNRIIPITQKNQGPGIARNNGILHANGEYIAFLDSDDYIEPNYVELVKTKIAKEGLDVVILDNFYEDDNGKVLRVEKLSSYKNLNKEQLIAVQMTGKMPWGGCRKVIKKSIIVDNQIEYSKDVVGEEAIFSFRVFYHSTKIGFLEKTVYHYVDYPQSQSKKGQCDPWGQVVDNMQAYITTTYGKDAYRKEINSFAYTALVVSLYRICNEYKILKALSHSRKKVREIKKKYSYDCNRQCMEKRVKLLMPFIKIGFMLPIFLISRMKKITKKSH